MSYLANSCYIIITELPPKGALLKVQVWTHMSLWILRKRFWEEFKILVRQVFICIWHYPIITIKGSDRTLTEVFNLCHTVPNRLCWSFKLLNTWHELFYRNGLKNFFWWNLSKVHTCAMREGSLCLKQSDELWFSFFYLRLLTCFPLAYTVLRAVTMCLSCVNVCVEQCLLG